MLWPQNPLTILPDSEPEPDVILLRYGDDFYRSALPGPADVELLIEVADTSLRYDRGVKGSLYAEAGVPEYWVVDLDGRGVEIYRHPAGGRSGYTERVGIGTTLSPLAFPDLRITVDSILA